MPPPEDTTLRKLVEAVTSLAAGLSNSERRAQRRHEEMMDALVIAMTGDRTAPNGHAIEATKKRGGEVSATFIVEGSRVEITEEHLKIVKGRVLRWVLVVLGLAASG